MGRGNTSLLLVVSVWQVLQVIPAFYQFCFRLNTRSIPVMLPAKKPVLDLLPRQDWYESFFLKYPIQVPAWYERGGKKTLIPGPTRVF
jgi:hypothetical protein